MRNCIAPEKVLAIDLYRLAHSNSYVTIGATLGIGKRTVIEAVQDVTESLFGLRIITLFRYCARSDWLISHVSFASEKHGNDVSSASSVKKSLLFLLMLCCFDSFF